MDRNDFSIGDRVMTDLPWGHGEWHWVERRNKLSLTVCTYRGGVATLPYKYVIAHAPKEG